MKNLQIRNQLLIIFTLIILAFSAVLFLGLDKYAKDLALNTAAEKAELLLAHQRAIRSYTIENVRPLINQNDADKFISESVPAFAAQTVMGHLNKSYPGYGYREAVENPTNPADALAPWERQLLSQYQSGAIEGRQTQERRTAEGMVYSIAEPIIITNPACLSCHSTAANAPASLVAKFPEGGGFGWELNKPLGIQSVTVPIELATLNKNEIRTRLVTAIALGLVLALLSLAIIVHMKVSGPLKKLSVAASKLSMGSKVVAGDFPDNSAEMRDIKLSLGRLFASVKRKMKNAGSGAAR